MNADIPRSVNRSPIQVVSLEADITTAETGRKCVDEDNSIGYSHNQGKSPPTMG